MSKFILMGRHVLPKHGEIACLVEDREGSGRMWWQPYIGIGHMWWEVYKVSHLRACANTGEIPTPVSRAEAIVDGRMTEPPAFWFCGLHPSLIIREEIARQRRAILRRERK